MLLTKRGEYHHSQEVRCKIRESKKFLSLESHQRIRNAQRGKHHSEESKQKNGNSHRGKKHSPRSLECREKDRVIHKELWRNPEYRKKQIDARVGKLQSSDAREKNRISHKRLWKDPTFVQSQLSKRGESPNKTEKLFQSFLDWFPGFRFVGDGQVIICGKCPDFINEEKHLIIELFGNYWHSQAVTGVPEEQHEKERKKLFELQGYRTLIVWERELEDQESLRKKIADFMV